MEEAIGRNVNVSVGDFELCILGIPYILVGCEPQGYILSYCSLVKKSLFFKMIEAFLPCVMWDLMITSKTLTHY